MEWNAKNENKREEGRKGRRKDGREQKRKEGVKGRGNRSRGRK